MTTGEKIKQIRQHRKMTQKELGQKIGLGDGGANRIAQYEMGYRVPKKPLLIKMAEALTVSPLALLEPSNRNCILVGRRHGRSAPVYHCYL